MPSVPAFILLALSMGALQAAKTLDIYFIDVEGGQSTLLVSPSGQTLLIDTGYPDFSGRDADRIAAAAKLAHVKRIDSLLITHYHSDHAGGVPNLLERLPVGAFFDHGPNVETTGETAKMYAAYAAASSKGERKTIQPGDKIPVKGLDVTVMVANARHIERKGEPNPFCAGLSPKPGEDGENPQSGGVLVQFGKFRFADLGDIVWNEELALMCPENRVGKVDVYLTDHHATHEPPKAVYALAPRVIVVDNGPRKGGIPEALKLLRATPGLEDMWQIHFSITGGKEANSPDPFIANVEERCQGLYLKLSAQADGSFTVYNPRNKYSKTY
jgi:beta-lactamase superfamily II metal-dependent hydrolase